MTIRAFLGAAAIVLYGTLASLAVAGNWPHHELIASFLQSAAFLFILAFAATRSHALPWNPPQLQAAGRWTATAILLFLALASVLSWNVVRGVTNPDESSYRFQARILAAGRLAAEPPTGAPVRPLDVPAPLKYNQHILWKNGWFSKYPIGWPMLLAIPERFGWPGIVNPMLASGILVCAAVIARSAFGPTSGLLAVLIAVLSPYFLAQYVTRMSHAAAGLLVAGSCLLLLKGLRSGGLVHFAAMYLPIVIAFHVRPLTALIAGTALTLGALYYLRFKRTLALKVLLMACLAACAAGGSVLLYNRAFTGSALVSPYALQRGVIVPLEISAALPRMANNLMSVWRVSGLKTVLFAFPGVFLLAAAGFWAHRNDSQTAWVLMSLFAAIVLGHLVQFESSGSVIPERYWFEGYFGVCILAGEGLLVALRTLRPSRRTLAAGACALSLIQMEMTAAASRILVARSSPSAAVRTIAETFSDCQCVVFLRDSPPLFYGAHLNRNGPDWKSAGAFYAVDPEPEQRSSWTRTLSRNRWIVVSYDPITQAGVVVAN